MRIFVTGAAGLVGTQVIRDLSDQGHSVRALDVKPLDEEVRSRAEMTYASVTDKMALLKAADGCDAVIHLAARTIGERSEDRTFHENVVGVQLVLSAAETLGIQRVSIASSNCAYGMAGADPPLFPNYLPIDEDHPLRPTDYYALSKALSEQVAAAFVRRCGMSVVCIRLSNVLKPPKNPKRVKWVRWGLRNQTDVRWSDFWAYVSLPDAARSFRLAVEHPLSGFHILNIAARDAFTIKDVRELVRQNMPELASYVEGMAPDQSLYNTSRAREVLGFVPEISWRDLPEYAGVENDSDELPF